MENKFEKPIVDFLYAFIVKPNKYAVLYDESVLYDSSDNKRKLFGSKKNKISNYEKYKTDLNLVDFFKGVSVVEHDLIKNSTMDLFKDIMDFCKFLRIAEKLFLYSNDEYNYVYSEIADRTWILFIKSEENEYKIRVKIEKTKIDNLLDDEYNIEKFFDDSKLTLITIDIAREYGKKMVTTFKFPLGAFPQYNDDSDKALFGLVVSLIRTKMKDCYFSIIEQTFKLLEVKNLSENTTYWECFEKNGLWLDSKDID